jgi:hypothetical protein
MDWAITETVSSRRRASFSREAAAAILRAVHKEHRWRLEHERWCFTGEYIQYTPGVECGGDLRTEEGTMTSDHEAAAYCSRCSEPVHFCERLQDHLGANIITLHEFYYNAAIHLLATCDVCMERFLDSLPDPIAAQFDDYLQGLLESDGPLALVCPFVVESCTRSEFWLKRSRIEPAVERLCGAVSERITRLPLIG